MENNRPTPPSAAAHAGTKRRRVEPSQIANKQKRSEVLQRRRVEKKKERRKARNDRKAEREELGDKAPPKQVPRTLDNTRELDDTIVAFDDEEVLADEAGDELAGYFDGSKTPKLMITTKMSPSSEIFRLIGELLSVIPNSFYYKRGRFPVAKISQWASNKNFSHLLVLSEKAKVPNGLLVCHLPAGPTAAFKLSSGRLVEDIAGHGRQTGHVPEIILNNFTTRLGRRVGRILGSMFPHNPEFRGRQVATFHNQRDFVFFRQHRYVFSEDGKKARLQELGPRFTLKMKWLMAGTFDPVMAEYEWVNKRHDMETSRRRFHL